MLKKLGDLPMLYGQSASHRDIRPGGVTFTRGADMVNQILDIKNLHISAPVCEIKSDRKSVKVSDREDESKYDISHSSKQGIFPDENLPNKVFNGVLYKELPIVNVKVTRNNTIINLTDHKGVPKLVRSCGIEGFRNAKKGTNLAAQATALTFSKRALDLGFKTVRVRIQGLGPGRISSVRGMMIGGLDIVSITDNCHVADEYPRPKKLRRL